MHGVSSLRVQLLRSSKDETQVFGEHSCRHPCDGTLSYAASSTGFSLLNRTYSKPVLVYSNPDTVKTYCAVFCRLQCVWGVGRPSLKFMGHFSVDIIVLDFLDISQRGEAQATHCVNLLGITMDRDMNPRSADRVRVCRDSAAHVIK